MKIHLHAQGWWTYELCPGLHLRQFHKSPDSRKVEQVIHLGFFKADTQPQQTEDQVLEATLVKDPRTFTRYYAKFLYTEGSKCFLHGEVRNCRLEISPSILHCGDMSGFQTAFWELESFEIPLSLLAYPYQVYT